MIPLGHGGVYIIQNITSGNMYIGSSKNLAIRHKHHFLDLQNGKHHNEPLQRAYKKCGIEALAFKLILYCEPKELLRYEQALIDLWEPQYNTCQTAGNRLGYKPSDSEREKISQSLRNHPVSDKSRAKMSQSAMGHKNNSGRHPSEETRKKISEANKGQIPTPLNRIRSSEANRGNQHSKGIFPSEETKKKMSEAQKVAWILRRKKDVFTC
jgi:group I intron endonuclease